MSFLVPTLFYRVAISCKETTLTMLFIRIGRFFDPDTKTLSTLSNVILTNIVGVFLTG